MRHLIVLLPLFSLAFAANAADKIDDVLRAAVDGRKVPGVVAMVARDGVVVYKGAFGNRMAVDTIFRIASMTKPVTSVAVMQLVEAGKVKLDAPASDYLPAMDGARVLERINPKTGEAVMHSPRGPVTVRQLLTHTSGYGYDRWDKT